MMKEQNESCLLKSLTAENTNMFEQARIMQALCASYHYTQASLASKLNVSQSYVGNKLRLLQFSLKEQSAILDFGLTERHARALLRAKPNSRERLISSIGNMRLTVRQTEDFIETYAIEQISERPNAQIQSNLTAAEFLLQMQRTADSLRSLGYKTTCLTESGDGWSRITVTVVE